MQNLIQLTDDQLVALYSDGNTKAFDTLLSRYQDTTATLPMTSFRIHL